jgi:hypothetical protein
LPAQVIPDEPGIGLPRFAVIGTYDGENSTFVRHVALLQEEGSVSFGSEAPVFHMGPPLVVGARSEAQTGGESRCPSHVVGWLGLANDERDGIIDWLAEVEKEDRPSGSLRMWLSYTVDPPECWRPDENGRRLYRRFSCGGFVLACYRDGAGIELINVTAPIGWPEISFDEIVRAYGPRIRKVRESLRQDLGIPGEGPWPILLAGYVIHAFNRSNDEIRTSALTVSDPALARFG